MANFQCNPKQAQLREVKVLMLEVEKLLKNSKNDLVTKSFKNPKNSTNLSMPMYQPQTSFQAGCSRTSPAHVMPTKNKYSMQNMSKYVKQKKDNKNYFQNYQNHALKHAVVNTKIAKVPLHSSNMCSARIVKYEKLTNQKYNSSGAINSSPISSKVTQPRRIVKLSESPILPQLKKREKKLLTSLHTKVMSVQKPNSSFAQARLFTNPSTNSKLSELEMKSKYSLVNNTAGAITEAIENNVTKKIMSSSQNLVLQRSTNSKCQVKLPMPSKPPANVVNTKYKIVNGKSNLKKKIDVKKHCLEKSKLPVANNFLKTPPFFKQPKSGHKLNSSKIGDVKLANYKAAGAVNSKYKIVNKPVINTSFSKYENDSTPMKSTKRKTSLQRSNNSANCLKKVKKLKVNNQVTGIDLTNISPEELVSMDHSSMLKLSEMISSSEPTTKAIVKKSKFKIVAKHRPKKTLTKQQIRRKMAWKAPAVTKNSPKYGSRNITTRFRKNNCVVVGGIPYKVSKSRMSKSDSGMKHKVIVVRGIRFKMVNSGKILKAMDNTSRTAAVKRIHFGGKTFIAERPGVLALSHDIQKTASCVLSRSIQRVVTASTRKLMKKNYQYCMFYNRFGKCNSGSSCKYIHDPSKIAVCSRFLRGTCKEENCLFSHIKEPGKMAVCLYFQQNACTNVDCPFRHTIIDPDAELCKPFVQGYCAKGSECKKTHILICPQYFKGECSKDDKTCPYPHPPRKVKTKAATEPLSVLGDCEPQSSTPEAEKNEEESSEKVLRYYEVLPQETTQVTVTKRTKVPDLPPIINF